MNGKKSAIISRREFARRAAMGSAAASIIPGELFAGEQQAASQPSPQGPPAPKLSPESQTEAEARFQSIISQYGSRFSEAQRADLKRLCFLAQRPLDRLRAFAVENGDGPALYLKPLWEREKKPAEARAPGNLPETSKSH